MSKTAFEVDLYTKYLGVLALMGRLINVNQINSDDRASVAQAYADANGVLKARGADIRFEKASGGGYAAFDV